MRIPAALLSLLFITSFLPGPPHNNELPEGNQGKPILSFGIVTDVHYCNENPSGNRFYRASLDKLREALSTFKTSKTDFVVNLGDLIDKNFESYLPVMHILDSSQLKIYSVTGNHDYYIDHKYFKSIPALAGNKSGFYSFVQNGFRFIFLNGNEVSTYSTHNKKIIEAANGMIAKLNKKGERNGRDNNGAIGADQIKWLTSQIDEAAAKSEKVFIFCHFPVFPEGEWNLFNDKDILQILNGYRNIIAWFNGHNHAGNYGNFNMIHFVNLKAMVETEKTNSFSIVEVYGNKIWIKGTGREKSQILAY
jgi:manganese-dependent ADP-ribose/CDP-alcohol diphosphatase